MRILGIDPGINTTGYGIIQGDKSEQRVITSGVISPSNKIEHSQRLAFLYDQVTQIIRKYQPDELAIEEAFFSENARTALVLGQARGAILLAAAHQDMNCYEYSPRKIKLAVVGNGSASKKQVQYMVKSILKYDQNIKTFDISDALAVALCHANQQKGLL